MTKKTSTGHTWDERYAEEGYAFGEEPNDFLREAVAGLTGGDVLVLGDGDGRNGVYLAQCGHRVTTIDLSEVGVAKARALAASRGVAIDAHVGDLETYDMGENRWDAIVSIFCHVPTELRGRVHAAVTRALRPGGSFILEAYNQANIGRGVGGPQVADMTVELAEVQSQFEGWHFVVVRQLEREIVEGKYHNGMSSVTQVLATKPAH